MGSGMYIEHPQILIPTAGSVCVTQGQGNIENAPTVGATKKVTGTENHDMEMPLPVPLAPIVLALLIPLCLLYPLVHFPHPMSITVH